MRGQLARRATTLRQSPDNGVVLAALVHADDGGVLLGCELHISHILAAARDEEVFVCQFRHRVADRQPLRRGVQRVLCPRNLLRADAVGEVAAVALMPALAERVRREPDKAL